MTAIVPPILPRVLFLDHVGELGGAELVLLDTARHLAGRSKVLLMADGPLRPALAAVGADVSVLPLSHKVSSIRRRSGILQSTRAAPHVLSVARTISRVARDYDLIWANSQKAFVIGCFAAALARRPLVWHLHDILTADHFSSTNRRIVVTLANRFASRVVTVSKAGWQSFIDSKGRPELACILHNGIDEASFLSSGSDSAPSVPIRQEFGIGTAPLVGSFGRLTAWKGQEILLRALPALPDVHAVFVGDALFNEHEYAASLRTLATKLGVAGRAHFAGFRSDIANSMAQVDLVAHTSTSPEPFGRVLVEAMLARRPLIASHGGGATEIVTHGHDGLLIPPGDPTLLSNAIRQILENKASTCSMVEHAYETAVSKFGLSQFLTGVDAVIAGVAKTS